MERIAAVGFGIIIIFLAYPRFRGPILRRLFNEGIVTPKFAKPENAEIIKHIGPDGSLFAIGFILVVIGVFFL